MKLQLPLKYYFIYSSVLLRSTRAVIHKLEVEKSNKQSLFCYLLHAMTYLDIWFLFFKQQK